MENDNNYEGQTANLPQSDKSSSPIDTKQLLADFEPLSEKNQLELLHLIQRHEARIERLNDELKRRQELLNAEKTRYFDLYNMIPLGCLSVNAKGMIVDANSHASCMLNVAHDTLTDLSIPRFIDDEDQDLYNHYHQQLFNLGEPQIGTLRMLKADRTVLPVQFKTVLSHDNEGKAVCHVIFNDNTVLAKIEKERELTAHLVNQVNTCVDLRECMPELTVSLQKWSGCEAVGIRLREGEDYPYYETRGLPMTFVEADSFLCMSQPDGELQRDDTGNPKLQCMCGKVISGQVDSSKPFFTPHGSFWTNNASTLPPGIWANDDHSSAHSRCYREGYESIALIPMRINHCILGLLQFNDHCPGRFNPELLLHLERISDNLALAIRRRQAEEKLRSSEEKYRTVANFTYAMETWRNPDGTYVYVSPSCERITGYTIDAFLKDPNFFEHIAHPEDQPKVIKHFATNHHAGKAENRGLEFRILTPDGKIRWLSHSCSAVFDDKGRWSGCRGSFREITKNKHAEEQQFQQQEKELQIKKSTSLNRMAGAIAHHFNNKLHVIMGYLELATETLQQKDAARYNIISALDAAAQASEVSKLMRVYLGHTKGRKEPLDLVEVCRECLPTFQPFMRQGLKLETHLHTPGPVINTNADEICQILIKTISNACESIADDEPGCIRLSVDVVASAEISSQHMFPTNLHANDESYACIEIQDNGCGLKESEIEEIFDPFYSTKFTGRGMGLPVVKGLVKAHGGAITVKSTPGSGTTIRAYFPLSKVHALPRLSSSVKGTQEIRWEGTVLVVEDDIIVLEITGILMEKMGFTVLTAVDGLDAIEIFRRHKDEIRFVLSDFAMPKLNGLETFHEMRKIDPDTLMILTSGHTEEHVMAQNPLERPQFFLKKPYNRQELKRVLELTMKCQKATSV